MVSKELSDFLAMLCTGLVLGLLFDGYRCLYRIFRPRRVVTCVFDFIYLLIAIIFSFTCLLLTNWAIIRFYLYMGIVSGFLLYYWLFSRLCFTIINKIVLVAVRVLRVPLRIVSRIWRKGLLFIKKRRKSEKNPK